MLSAVKHEVDVARSFDAEAARYDAAYDKPGPHGHLLRLRLSATLDLVGEGPGRLLDAGMGPGRLCAEACRRGWSAVGVDISECMVAMAKLRCQDLNASTAQASVAGLPFREATFDAVVATGLIGYLATPQHHIAELARVLRPDGRLIVSVSNVDSLAHRLRGPVWYPAVRFAKRRVGTSRPAPPHRPGAVSLRQLEAILASCGLTMSEPRYVGVLVIVSQLEHLWPSATKWLSTRRKWTGRRVGTLLAAQIVVSAQSGPA